MDNAVDLVSKVLTVLGALLGLAGYVLVLGATILWFRLDLAGLPHETPISLASRQELIAIGAQAVAVWVLLTVLLGLLAAWIAVGDPKSRRFGNREAALAITVTASAVLALDSSATPLVWLPILAVAVVAIGGLSTWPEVTIEEIATPLLPALAGLGLGFALSMVPGNGVPEALGATLIFGALLVRAPHLQQWRARQEANQAAIAQVEAKAQLDERGREPTESENDPLVRALEQRLPEAGSPSGVRWVRRIAVAIVVLLVLGVVAVASQIQRDEDFHRALVSLVNGDCVKGTYVVRGSEQIVLAQPEKDGDEDEDKAVPPYRITTIPAKEVLEVQIYGKSIEGAPLKSDIACGESRPLVHSTAKKTENAP
jgi:hypothetical protein